MSYYFTIIGTKDNPIFEHEFGTSKQGGDGVARFPEQARHMNQFIVHSSLDIVEEVQWGGGQMYVHLVLYFCYLFSLFSLHFLYKQYPENETEPSVDLGLCSELTLKSTRADSWD